MRFEDFSDASCTHDKVCLHGRPRISKAGEQSVLYLDGLSYVEVPPVATSGPYLQESTLMVRFIVKSLPIDSGVILSIGKTRNAPIIRASVDHLGNLPIKIQEKFVMLQYVSCTSILFIT